MRYVFLALLFLAGCASTGKYVLMPLEEKITISESWVKDLPKEEKIIILSFERVTMEGRMLFPPFWTAKYLKGYGKYDLEGFWEYLKTNTFLKFKTDAFVGDIYKDVWFNYNLLKEIIK